MSKKRIIITEEQLQDLRLPDFIYKAISSNNTSIGDNPAIPPYGNFGFVYDLIKREYNNVSTSINELIERGELESNDNDYLVSMLSKYLTECRKIERTFKPQLEKLCENIVNKKLATPVDTIELKCSIVDKITPKNIAMFPEDGEGYKQYDFEDVDEVELTNKVVLKRRFINSLVQGFSYWLSNEIDEWKDEINSLNSDLWHIWNKILIIDNYLLYNKKEKISDKNPMQESYVEVHLGKGGKKTKITAQGIIFPYLLKETFRGFLELFSSHGLPENDEKAMYIIRKSDFILAEPWDMRIGYGLIHILNNVLTDKYETQLLSTTTKIPYFFMKVCSLETDKFNMYMKNVLIGTKKGGIMSKHIDSKINHDIEYQAFKDKIQQKNVDTSVIEDGEMSSEELDNYVLQENDVEELKAYHGSGANFDRFNHKKYLNTGAGSQTFGWGTYVTDDEAVANGYTEATKFNKMAIDAMGNRKGTYSGLYAYFKNNLNYADEAAKENADILAYWIKTCLSLSELRKFIQSHIDDEINPEKKKIYQDYLIALREFRHDDAFLYEVEIPDNNGLNYLNWHEEIPQEQMKRVVYTMLNLKPRILNYIADRDYVFKINMYNYAQFEDKEKMTNLICKDPSYSSFFGSQYVIRSDKPKGMNLYRKLQSWFDSDKAASLFLMQCGFDGIIYKAGTIMKKPDGSRYDSMNYVIFDANKVKIVNKTIQ